MGTTVSAPPPSKEELELRTAQKDLLVFQQETLQAQLKRQELLDPILFEELGLIQQFDEQGNLTGFTQADDPTGDLRDENEFALLQRQQKALAGELPISPTLERELGEQEQSLNERLR